jgi:hypothetical protein
MSASERDGCIEYREQRGTHSRPASTPGLPSMTFPACLMKVYASPRKPPTEPLQGAATLRPGFRACVPFRESCSVGSESRAWTFSLGSLCPQPANEFLGVQLREGEEPPAELLQA